MWDVSHIDEREFTYMGYEVELEIFTERDYTTTRKRVVQTTARKDGTGTTQFNPMQSSGEHVINIRNETNVDGEEKLFGLIEVKPTPLEEQIEDVVQETKVTIEESVDERISSRKEADDVLEDALDDDDIELPPEEPEDDSD